MKELGIRSIVTKKFRPTRSSQKVDEKPNLLNQDLVQISQIKNGLAI